MILDGFSKTFNVTLLLFICLGLRIIEYVQRLQTPKASNMEGFSTIVKRVTALLNRILRYRSTGLRNKG